MAEQQRQVGGGGSSSSSLVMRDYRKGNWTVNETMVLIEAKRMDDERRMKRSSDISSEGRGGGGKPTELRWKWVEDYCWRKGCLRSQNQCNDKWDNLMRDYKKVRDYERRMVVAAAAAGDDQGKGGGGGGEREGEGDVGSYWKLEKNERKERNLPSNLLFQIYEALVEVVERRGGGGSGSSGGGGLATPSQSQRVVVVGGSGSSSINPGLVGYHHQVMVERERPSSRVVQVSMPPPPPPHHHHLLQHQQVSSATPPPSQVMPLPPPPPPIPPSQPPPPTSLPPGLVPFPINPCSHPLPSVDSEDTSEAEYSGSPAKRRRRSGNNGGGGEGTSTGGGGGDNASPSSHHDHGDHDHHNQVGNAISRSASIIAEAIHACEEREERRHRDLMALHERRLRVEESKTEISKQGISGLVEAINNLATSILALASHNNNKNQPT